MKKKKIKNEQMKKTGKNLPKNEVSNKSTPFT